MMTMKDRSYYENVYNRVKESLRESFKDVIPKIDYSAVLENYLGRDKKYKFVCEKHGEFEDYLYRALLGPKRSKILCPKCRSESKQEKVKNNLALKKERKIAKRTSFRDRIKDIEPYDPSKENYGDYVCRKLSIMFKDYPYDFSKSVYSGLNKSMEVRCKIHGIFHKIPHELYKGYGCPECGKNDRYNGIKVTKEDIQEYIDGKYNKLYTIKEETFSIASNPFTVTCKLHGDFVTSWKVLKVSGCKQCHVDNMRKNLKTLLSKTLNNLNTRK